MGSTPHPDEAFVVHTLRVLADHVDGVRAPRGRGRSGNPHAVSGAELLLPPCRIAVVPKADRIAGHYGQQLREVGRRKQAAPIAQG
jgi:hypothetical protein